MVESNISCDRDLVLENEELKRNLALALNKPLIKKLQDALERINNNDYISEKEFFNQN